MLQDIVSNKPTHLIAIDAGATKAVAVVQEISSQKSWRVLVGSASLTNDLKGACGNIQSVLAQLIKQSGCDARKSIIVCGIAGAGNQQRVNALRDVIGDSYFQV